MISVAYYYVVTKIPGSTAALYSGEFTTAAIMGLVINYAGTLVLLLAVSITQLSPKPGRCAPCATACGSV